MSTNVRCLMIILCFNINLRVLSSERVISDGIDPDYKTLRGLVCYQCNSDTSRDLDPYCDSQVFHLTTPEEKRDMLVQCPRDRSTFCIKKVVTGPDFVHTTRGCSGPYDEGGNLIKTGCILQSTGVEVIVCICKGYKCNKTTRLVPPDKFSTHALIWGVVYLIMF